MDLERRPAVRGDGRVLTRLRTKGGQSFKSQTQALQAAFAAEPRMKGGLEAASKELAKIQGVALRSMMYFTLVPAGIPFNRSLALNEVSASIANDSSDKGRRGGTTTRGEHTTPYEQTSQQRVWVGELRGALAGFGVPGVWRTERKRIENLFFRKGLLINNI
jgi:ribosome modulation factor